MEVFKKKVTGAARGNRFLRYMQERGRVELGSDGPKNHVC